MPTASAMVMPKKYFFDVDNEPLAFGEVFTYEKGSTTTAKTTYTSETGDVANSNPVVLNGEGYASIYLKGSYGIIVKDEFGATIWSEDPVSGEVAEEWVNCESASYVSTTKVLVAGDLTSEYDVERRVRIDNNTGTPVYNSVKSVSFSGGNTTIEFIIANVAVGVVGVCASIIGSESIPTDQDPSDELFVNSSAEMTALTPGIGDVLYVAGIENAFDGRGGHFSWDEANTDTEVKGIIYETDAGGVGRWLRIIEGELYANWFESYKVNEGASFDITTALNEIFSYVKAASGSKQIIFDAGTAYCNTKPDDIDFPIFCAGQGKEKTIFVKDFQSAAVKEAIFNLVNGAKGSVLDMFQCIGAGGSQSGTTGTGSLVSLVADSAAAPNNVDVTGLLLTSNGGASSRVEYSLYVDGSAKLTAPAGIVNLKVHCDIAGAELGTAKLYSVRKSNITINSIAGQGDYSTVVIGGVSSAKSENSSFVILGINDNLDINNSNELVVNAAINGNLNLETSDKLTIAGAVAGDLTNTSGVTKSTFTGSVGGTVDTDWVDSTEFLSKYKSKKRAQERLGFYVGRVTSAGVWVGAGPTNWTVTRVSLGIYRITTVGINPTDDSFVITATAGITTAPVLCHEVSRTSTYFEINTEWGGGSTADVPFNLICSHNEG